MKSYMSNLLLIATQALIYKQMFIHQLVVSTLPVINKCIPRRETKNLNITHQSSKQQIKKEKIQRDEYKNEYPVIMKKPKSTDTQQNISQVPASISNSNSTIKSKDTLQNTEKLTSLTVVKRLPMKHDRKNHLQKDYITSYNRFKRSNSGSYRKDRLNTQNNFKKLFTESVNQSTPKKKLQTECKVSNVPKSSNELKINSQFLTIQNSEPDVKLVNTLKARVEYKLIPQKLPNNYSFLRGIESMERAFLTVTENLTVTASASK